MYMSRLHATNGIVSVALDALSGEILELISETRADNVVKSHLRKFHSPLAAVLTSDQGERTLYPARYAEINLDPSLRPAIAIDQQERSAKVTIDYPALVCEGARYEVSARVTIELPDGECRTLWRLSIEHCAGDAELTSVQFPCVGGLWLGERFEDDQLVMPFNAGERIQNPVETLARAPVVIGWKWQEYNYGYTVDGPSGERDARGAYVRELPYSGPGSMLWMDLYDEVERGGLYLTCRNDGLIMKALRAETFGPSLPGMGLSIVHYPCLNGGSWHSEECVLALHPGDWHWAADDYRTWREGLRRPALKPHRPEWFEKSPGLVAHYDFKYQGGGIVHRYRDIPALYEQARSFGMSHLLISGWNFDGFDHGFPQYRVDPDLGTEQDLIDAVRAVRKAGGHLAFYINSRLCNTKYSDRADLIRDCAIMNRDGVQKVEKYGAANLEFACLCNQATEWRDEFVGVVDYLTHVIGADSMYLDQLCMGSALLCYHSGHAEHRDNPAGWNQGYEKMLTSMRAGYEAEGMAMLYEGVSDIHGAGVSGQLISTMFYLHNGAYPELYKYTFPDQILVDMMNPRRNSGMRAEHVARKSTYLLHKAFVVGSYLWVYDLEFDNSFRRDPEQLDRLRHINALRSAWLNAYGQGRFTDTIGLMPCAEGVLAKRFEIEDGALVACAREGGLSGEIAIRWPGGVPCAFARTYERPDQEIELTCGLRFSGGEQYAYVALPSTEMAVIAFRKGAIV